MPPGSPGPVIAPPALVVVIFLAILYPLPKFAQNLVLKGLDSWAAYVARSRP